MDLDLSESQKQTVAAGITIVAVFVNITAFAAIVWVLSAFVDRFAGVLMPLAVAGILALVFNPMFEWLRARMPVPVALLAMFLSIAIPVGAFVWFFGALVVDQVSALIEKVPEMWGRFSAWAEERWPEAKEVIERYQLADRLREAAEEQVDAMAQGVQFLSTKAFSAGAAVARGLGALLGWAVMPVYFIFFLLGKDKELGTLEEYLPFLKSETRCDIAFLVREFIRILVSFFRGQLVIAFLQGLLFAVGFSAVGLHYGFVIGLVLGFLNVIPYLGSIVGLGVAIPLAYFQDGGGLGRVVAVLVVFTIVQIIEGYVLTPKIMGDRTGLHPMMIIVAVFFWGSALGGIMGMILAIPLTAFLVVFWRLAREKYIKELV